MSFNLTITVDAAHTFGAYAANVDDAPKPCVIICPEVFGVNSHMRSVADGFAAKGFLAVVPDLFWRIEPGLEIPYDNAGLKRGSQILLQFDAELAAADVGLVMAAVRQMSGCSGKVGVLGFCVGGTVAYLAATRLDTDAAVGYYAKGVERHLDESSQLRCDLVLHYGEKDRFIPAEVVQQVEDGLRGHNGVEIYVYPGVDHGFNSNDRRAYDPVSATLAMARTMALLDRTLRSPVTGVSQPESLRLNANDCRTSNPKQ